MWEKKAINASNEHFAGTQEIYGRDFYVGCLQMTDLMNLMGSRKNK